MGHIPSNAEWYIGEIILEITVEGDSRNVVHRNFVLIRATIPEEAYERALALGKEGEISYLNPGGRQVSFRFRGVAQLTVIDGKLAHGTELFYEETVGVPHHEVDRWIPTKDQLNIFRPPPRSEGPDYTA